MADDYGGLAPPSSSSTPLPAADAIGGDTVEEEGVWSMDRRRKLGPTGNTESHYQSAAAAAGAAASDDKSAANASMFFSETSVSDRDEWDGAITEDDTTLRGMDVDIIGRSPSRSRATPSPHALLSSPGISPGNTSLSSSNLSPHQRRYRPTRDRPLPQLGLGPEMLVPTLGIPVARRSGGNGGMTGIGSTVPATKSKKQRSTITAKSNASKSDGDSNQVVEGSACLSAPPAAVAETATPSSSDLEKDMAATRRAGVGVSHSFLPNYGDMAAAMAAKGHRRKRSWSSGGQPAPVHRRTRSGDGKAAGLLTGGMDWKGMELDKLPLPDPIPYDKVNKSSSNDGPSGGGAGNRKAAADARKMIEARYGTALMGRSTSNKSMGYSETDDSEQEGQMTGKGRAPLPMPPPSGSARPFSPESNASMSEDTSQSTHSLFSWISGRFSAVSGKSKSSLARLRSGRPKGRDSSITFGSSGATSLSVGTCDASSFSPTTSNGPTSVGKGLPARAQEFGETAPLLERKDESNHSSNRTDTDEVASFSDPDEDLFRQRKVMMQIGGTERESPDIGRPSPAAAPFVRTKSNFSRPSFAVPEHEADKYPTFICPNCNTRQRNFFTVSSAPTQFESPAGYLAFYMAIYVVSSLFIFGLEEGWPALDCVYFAVITLTTSGLGDYVPSTDGAKIICSIFIYFGVACIGLLLGSLLASGLDDASRKRAKETMVDNCPNCARIEAQSRTESKRPLLSAQYLGPTERKTWYSERSNEGSVPSGAPNVAPNGPPLHKMNDDRRKIRFDDVSPSSGTGHVFSAPMTSPPGQQGPHIDLQPQPVYASEATPLGYNQSWGQQQQQRQNHNPFEYSPSPAIQNSGYMQYGHSLSPLPSNVMPRQTHTRHMSFDVHNVANGPGFPTLTGNRSRNFSMDVPGQPVVNTIPPAPTPDNTEYAQIGGVDGDDYSDSYSTASSSESGESSYSSSSDSEYDPMVPLSKVQSAKYVFLTLRQALANSVFHHCYWWLWFLFHREDDSSRCLLLHDCAFDYCRLR